MCTIGIFIIGHAVSLAFGYRRSKESILWQKIVALVRYLAYRGFHIRALAWNSAPVGVLLLGLLGTVFFFCKPPINTCRECELISRGMVLAPKPYYWPDIMFGGSPPLATRSGWMALACMPFVLYVSDAETTVKY
jgi:uncharacterized membrane protein